MQRQLIKALAELVKHKNGRELCEDDENYMIIRPKVNGILSFLNNDYLLGLNNGLYGGFFGPCDEEISDIKTFRNNIAHECKRAVFFETPYADEQYMYNMHAYILGANTLYAIPISDMMYSESKIETIVTVIGSGIV